MTGKITIPAGMSVADAAQKIAQALGYKKAFFIPQFSAYTIGNEWMVKPVQGGLEIYCFRCYGKPVFDAIMSTLQSSLGGPA
jgi:hypothetical protein